MLIVLFPFVDLPREFELRPMHVRCRNHAVTCCGIGASIHCYLVRNCNFCAQ